MKANISDYHLLEEISETLFLTVKCPNCNQELSRHYQYVQLEKVAAIKWKCTICHLSFEKKCIAHLSIETVD